MIAYIGEWQNQANSRYHSHRCFVIVSFRSSPIHNKDITLTAELISAKHFNVWGNREVALGQTHSLQHRVDSKWFISRTSYRCRKLARFGTDYRSDRPGVQTRWHGGYVSRTTQVEPSASLHAKRNTLTEAPTQHNLTHSARIDSQW